MNSPAIKILIAVLGAVLLAEGIFYYLAKTGRLDIWGYQAQQTHQIKGTVWGVAGAASARAIQALGKQWIKIDLYWQEAEEDGWENFRAQLQEFENHHLIVTLHSNSRKETVCAKKLAVAQSSCPPLEIGKYQEFVKKAVRESGDKVKFWQIEDRALNGGDYWQGNKEQYVRLLEAAHTAIQEADKDSRVILAGMALGNLNVNDLNDPSMQILEENLTYVFSQAKTSFDIVDIHLFSRLDSVPGRVKWLENKMKAQNFLKPIWSLEMSGPDLTSAEYTPDLQAQEVVKRFLIGFESGIEKILYFQWQDQETGQSDPLSATLGLLDKDGVQKPAYTAYQQMVGRLAGFNHLRKLNLKDDTVGYQTSFAVREPVFVFWSPEKVKLTLPTEIKDTARAEDYLGAPVAITDGKLAVDEKPVYVLVD